MPKTATRIMGGPKLPTGKPSLTLCQQLTPGIGLRMGMEPSGGGPPPVVENELISEGEELLHSESDIQLIAQ
jgi:hypothetical protein